MKEIFVPKNAIYNAAGKDEILVAGTVDGTPRNAPIVKNAQHTAKYNTLVSMRDEEIERANRNFLDQLDILNESVFDLAIDAFNELQPKEKE